MQDIESGAILIESEHRSKSIRPAFASRSIELSIRALQNPGQRLNAIDIGVRIIRIGSRAENVQRSESGAIGIQAEYAAVIVASS